MPATDMLSIQLYTLRSLNDLDTVLDVAAAAGRLQAPTSRALHRKTSRPAR
jgi:hypothetical protein